ncbi:MAG: hypothetical protein OHK0019_00140 [Saprospiraceae bacterium]
MASCVPIILPECDCKDFNFPIILPECDFKDFNFPNYKGIGRVSEITMDGFSIELSNKQIIDIVYVCPEWLRVGDLVQLEMGGNEYTLSLVENADD